jgi:MoaA/NifB/PqqE/SkfB family radical SAM enzyme
MDIKLKLFELALRQKILGKGIKGKSFTPQIVSYAVTRKCNLNCPHCHANAGKSEPDELSLREATRAIYEMADLKKFCSKID